MGRKRLYSTPEESQTANYTQTRRKTALMRLLTSRKGKVRFGTPDAAADAAWIVAQPAAIARGARAENIQAASGEVWIVTVRGVESNDAASA